MAAIRHSFGAKEGGSPEGRSVTKENRKHPALPALWQRETTHLSSSLRLRTYRESNGLAPCRPCGCFAKILAHWASRDSERAREPADKMNTQKRSSSQTRRGWRP